MDPVRAKLAELICEALSSWRIEGASNIADTIIAKLFEQNDTTRALLGDCIGIGGNAPETFPLVLHFESENDRLQAVEHFQRNGMSDQVPRKN